jgi:nucleoside-triphosphatase
MSSFSRSKRVCLLSGQPGCGKTTIIRELLSKADMSAGGFYTEEIRVQGVRRGFRIATIDGATATLAHVDISSPYRVGKYGVDLGSLDEVGVPALREATKCREIVVVDEIGKMELFSALFREAVVEALGSGKKVVGTVMLSSHPWADELKRRDEVQVVLVTRENRREILDGLVRWMES